MAEIQKCSTCYRMKPAGDYINHFIHPRTGKEGATCAECIIKRSERGKLKPRSTRRGGTGTRRATG